MSTMILAVLQLIEQILPLLTGNSNASNAIDSIIAVLQKWMPFIIAEVSTLYQPVKNIIAALSANPATIAAQAATLAQLDATMDTAFEAAAAAVDPDAAPSV